MKSNGNVWDIQFSTPLTKKIKILIDLIQFVNWEKKNLNKN